MAKIIGNTTATPNPRPDWNQIDVNKADYIKNKPTVLTRAEVIGLIKENGGDVGVQSDWNQTDSTQLDYIKNKPEIVNLSVDEENIVATEEQTSFTTSFTSSENLQVYHNGILLIEGTNYTFEDSVVTLIGDDYKANAGDTFTFVQTNAQGLQESPTTSTQYLKIDVEDRKNLFDGNCYDTSYGMRMAGSSFTCLEKDDNYPAVFFVLPVEEGHFYKINYEAIGKESYKDITSGAFYYQVKIGASDKTAKELRQAIINKETVRVNRMLNQSSAYNAAFGVWAKKDLAFSDSTGGTFTPKSIIFQFSANENIPFVQAVEVLQADFNAEPGTTYGDRGLRIFNSPCWENEGDELNYGKITISQGRNQYVFKHCISEFPTDGTFEYGASYDNLNTWRLYKQCIDNKVLFENSDCEGVIQLDDAKTQATQEDYIGGIHGDEVITDIKMLVDGVMTPVNKEYIKEKCSNITFIIKSKLYNCNSNVIEVSDYVNNGDGTYHVTYLDGNVQTVTPFVTTLNDDNSYLKAVKGFFNNEYEEKKFMVLNNVRYDALFNRIKKIEFTNGKVNISNYWKYIGPNNKYGIFRSYLTGLYSIIFNSLTAISTNYTKALIESPSVGIYQDEGWNSHLDKATFYGNNFNISVKVIDGKTETYSGKVANMQAIQDEKRLKVYFAAIDTSGIEKQFILTKGQELFGEFEIETSAP